MNIKLLLSYDIYTRVPITLIGISVPISQLLGDERVNVILAPPSNTFVLYCLAMHPSGRQQRMAEKMTIELTGLGGE